MMLITLFENRALFIGFYTQVFVDKQLINTGINKIITSYNLGTTEDVASRTNLMVP